MTRPASADMTALPIRLLPGDDLRRALEARVPATGSEAAFVVGGIGSLGTTRIRLAGAADATGVDGDVEILTLSGSIGASGSHLHASVSDATGRVSPGPVASGCIVRTTGEILVAVLPGWHFMRERDAATGDDELVTLRADR